MSKTDPSRGPHSIAYQFKAIQAKYAQQRKPMIYEALISVSFQAESDQEAIRLAQEAAGDRSLARVVAHDEREGIGVVFTEDDFAKWSGVTEDEMR